MDFLNSFFSDFFSVFGSINFEVIAQLTVIGLIFVSGPVVIFLLAARSGDL